jgi:hypothetical protein
MFGDDDIVDLEMDFDKKFSILEQKYKEINEKSDILEQKYKEINEKSDILEQKYKEINEKSDILEQKYKENDERLTSLEKENQYLETYSFNEPPLESETIIFNYILRRDYFIGGLEITPQNAKNATTIIMTGRFIDKSIISFSLDNYSNIYELEKDKIIILRLTNYKTINKFLINIILTLKNLKKLIVELNEKFDFKLNELLLIHCAKYRIFYITK